MEHGTGHPSPTTGPTRQPLARPANHWPPRQLRSSSLTLALPGGSRESKGQAGPRNARPTHQLELRNKPFPWTCADEAALPARRVLFHHQALGEHGGEGKRAGGATAAARWIAWAEQVRLPGHSRLESKVD